VSKSKVRQVDVANNGGILFCTQKRNTTVRNRVEKWKHLQGLALLSLTARSADIFIYLSNTKVK
jgi:hypothetical protein